MSGPPSPSYSIHLRKHDVVLWSVRLYLALGIGMLPGVGVMLDRSGLLAVDPPGLRYGMALAMGALLGATFVSERAREYVREGLLGLAALLLVWLGALLVLNDFAAVLGPIYFTAVLTGGALLSVAFRGITATALFLATALGVASVSALQSSAPGIDPGLFLVCLVACSAVILVTASIRERLMQSVERGQQLYAEAEAAGAIGSWEIHLASGRARWSDGLCGLLGIPPLGGAPAPSLDAFVHPDDLQASQAAFDSVAGGDLHEHSITARITDVGGRERTLRGVVRAERNADGKVVRVVGVGVDVTAHLAHQAELVEALDRAEAAARLKEAILANMSHEIRTPLTAVIGYAEMLAEEADAETMPLVVPIVDGGQRLLDTLNSVLDLARLEAEGASLVKRPVDLATAAAAVHASLAETAAAAGLAFSVEGQGNVWASSDAGALGRVLDNLVSNAIRFTDAGHVLLRVGTEGQQGYVEVEDTGRGMSQAFVQRAVEAFVQESAGDARSHEGSGLGLSIVSRLVDALDGELGIVTAPGAGTTVRVTLPLASPEVLAAPAPEVPIWVARRQLATAPAPV